ncbi:hypothetical protein Tco_0314291, partial [Tanacetum coccineum]
KNLLFENSSFSRLGADLEGTREELGGIEGPTKKLGSVEGSIEELKRSMM